MKNEGKNNINNDYSNNPLHINDLKNISHTYDSNFINNLNNSKYNNNEEEAISTKGNINQEEKNFEENSIKNNTKDDSLIINPKSFNEKLTNNDSNLIEIKSINSIDKNIKFNKNKIKKTPLQEYLQGGYKKFPHAKNNRLLIEHYDNWQGNNYFPYGAHIIEGPCSFRPTMASGLAVTLPVALFIGFNAEYITKHWTIAILIVAGVLALFVLIFLILGSFRDPGIIRRHYYNGFYKFERKNSKIFHLGFIRHYKYCGTCSIMRPIRSSHCFDCNNCVERCDHHCPWIGNCVGKRNYWLFYLFVVCLTISILYIEAFCVAHIWKYLHDKIKENDNKKNSEQRDHISAYSLCDLIMDLYLIIYGIIILAFTLGLLFYHTKLVLTNTTTKEMLKFIWNNPFGNSFNRNFEYNFDSAMTPEIKKYSLLDILRNGKKMSNLERNEREKMIQQQLSRNISKYNQNKNKLNNILTNGNINNSFNNNFNIFNNFENTNLNKFPINQSLKEKKLINIDPNEDIIDIEETKKNLNSYNIDFDKNTFSNSLYGNNTQFENKYKK